MATSRIIGSAMTPFGAADVYVGRYPAGGAIAVQLLGSDTGEPLGIFSTNLVPYGAQVGDTEFHAKVWSENEPLVAPMLASGLFEDTGRTEASGFVMAPVWRIRNPEHVPPLTRRLRPR
ncbi:hypothetical protein [Methylibium rhizosphaerae]|uniref:hypothetical protein n=1 Tax=Methylibium rhizosphaerae TaxID=2570323 RepID=UPI001127D005|nr:hypothetical protein [Methylibium rhizosphaerae]